MWINSNPAILFPKSNAVSPGTDVSGIFWNKFKNNELF